MQDSNELNNSGMIRLIIFIAMIIGCLYLGIYYSVAIAKFSFIDSWPDTLELSSVGSDLKPILFIVSFMIKSYGIGFIIAAVLICSLGILLVTIIAFLIFRAASIRRDSYISETEYKITKRLLFAAFIIGIIMPIFFSGFKCLFWSPVLNFSWFLSALIYVITIENRHLAGQRALTPNPNYSFESMSQMQSPGQTGAQSGYLPPNFNHPSQSTEQSTAQDPVPSQNPAQPQNPYQPQQNLYQPQDPYQPQQNPYQPQPDQNPYRNPYDPDSKYQ